MISVITSLLIGAIFIAAIGQNPLEVYLQLFSQTLGNTYGIGQVLFKATPLIFTGLSVAIAFKAGLFNIGAEGQLNIGAFASAWVGFTFVTMPWYILIPISILAGFIGGALWASIAGVLKAKFGSHEVINTIMLNFIALALVSYLVNNVYPVPATIHTPEISPNAWLQRFDVLTGAFKGSPFNLSFLIALAACLLMYYLLWKTPLGYQINTLGLNKGAAEYSKMNVKKLIMLSMALAGGFAGLGGLNFVNGYKHYLELGFSENAGYIGIAVALIARNNPWGIIIAAIFFGILEYGGLTINTLVPKEIITILQAIVILIMISINHFIAQSRYKKFNAGTANG
ncbi:MAG: ABC transporter permease [Ignavibacteria bacterium]|nr:ABC transporter permease [Ignavibacteria bacterium]